MKKTFRYDNSHFTLKKYFHLTAFIITINIIEFDALKPIQQFSDSPLSYYNAKPALIEPPNAGSMSNSTVKNVIFAPIPKCT